MYPHLDSLIEYPLKILLIKDTMDFAIYLVTYHDECSPHLHLSLSFPISYLCKHVDITYQHFYVPYIKNVSLQTCHPIQPHGCKMNKS